MSDDVRHPALDQFRRALEDRKVDSVKKTAFDRWRNNPAKCPPETPLKAAADELWRQLEALGATADVPKHAQSQRTTPSARDRPSDSSRGSSPQRGDNAGAAPPSCLGAPFHNAYTFIPFSGTSPRRRPPTPLTIDERERERFTGMVELTVRTLSPLLTCDPSPIREAPKGHKHYRALIIGDDVVVPATGVRGSLRTLMTVLTSGTLGYLDEDVWLCQGRDRNLGPAGPSSPADTPASCFLARVTRPGTRSQAGIVKLGKTRLVKAQDLEAVARRCGIELSRPEAGQRAAPRWCNDDATSLKDRRDDQHRWQVKLSGRPVNERGKREGLFLDDGPEIELPASVWAAYLGRNRHGDHGELCVGDLVWLQPVPSCVEIKRPEEVLSIQWARWGREGERLLDVVRCHHPEVLPDAFNPDGWVDEVCDLFGQVPRPDLAREAFPDWREPTPERPGPAGPFAARIRPENLVFRGAAKGGIDRGVPLAPLQPPHPGCAAFYRDEPDPDRVANHGRPLRGYKVYRTTRERADGAAWHYQTQGVYDDAGRLKVGGQKVNKTCDLLGEGHEGRLRVACRALSTRELALLLAACTVDWRLGGGKPLGLGHCRIVRVRVIDEDGKECLSFERQGEDIATLPEPLGTTVSDIRPRLELWQATQQPVDRLRYPRAVNQNQNRKQRGGHAWFQRHAQPRKNERGARYPEGLQALWTEGPLQEKAGGKDRIAAQPLPLFSAARPNQDVLYGYDLIEERSQRDKKRVATLEPFDEQRHARQVDRSGGPQGQNRARRRDERKKSRLD
jgi:hypothetical protein